MRLAAKFVALLLGSLAQIAIASEVGCNAITELQGEETAGCKCGSELAKFSVTAPRGMKLLAACNARKVHGSWEGGFYFKGAFVQSGTVKREFNELFGDSLWFSSENETGYSELASAIHSLKFWDDPVAIKKFDAPAPTDKVMCWTTESKIEVKLLYVLAGGTDEAGSYPKKFRVISRGKYRPCDR